MGLKLAGIMLILMMAMGGLGYWYYNDTQEKMSILHKNNAKLETAAALNEETISSLQVSYEKANNELNRLNQEFANIRAQNKILAGKLEKHDLGVLGSKKPTLVERVINKATQKAGRCFELLAGAPLTEDEKNEKNGKSFNSECPWLFNSHTTP